MPCSGGGVGSQDRGAKVGAGAGVAGGVLSGLQAGVRNDPASLGPQKEKARTLGLAGFGMLVGGATLALVGGITAIVASGD